MSRFRDAPRPCRAILTCTAEANVTSGLYLARVLRMATTSDLIDLVYSAVPDASRWQVFLETFVRTTGCKRGTLILNAPGVEEWMVVCRYGWREEEARLYNERYAVIDPWGLAAAHVPEGEIRTSVELCSKEELEQSVAYREYYQPLGVEGGFGGVFLRTNAGSSAIAVARGKEQGPCGEREISILRPLMPHLRRAAILHGELASMRVQLATFTGHLDRYPHPFLLTDADSRVLYANAAAREITARRDGLAIEAGRIVITTLAQHRALRKAIGEVSGGQGLPLRRLEVARPSRKHPYRVLVMNVPNSGALPLGIAQPAAAVLVVDGESGAEPDPAILRELFSLTPAEARVTGRLVLGRSVEEIAQELGTSIETVRSQVRSILSKTSTTRQGEMISLVLRMAPFRNL
jgi:DNA-binding CsgD family transcriptional regulator